MWKDFLGGGRKGFEEEKRDRSSKEKRKWEM